MKAIDSLLFVGLFTLFTASNGARAVPTETALTNLSASGQLSTLAADRVRPEDVMIDDDAIGDVWDTVSPADAIGISAQEADVLPAVTAALSSVELLKEKALLAPPDPDTEKPQRVHTKRWRPQVPLQTLFYLGLAIVVVVVLLLKSKEP